MSIQIYTNGHIIIDGEDTGLGVCQCVNGTEVYDRNEQRPVKMPNNRYTLSSIKGQAKFEADIRAILEKA